MADSRNTVHMAPKGKHALVSKFLVCLVDANGNFYHASEIAKERCAGLPVLPKVFHAKGAVGAQTSASDPYGFNEAVPLALIADELQTLLAAFARVPFRTKTPEENAVPATAGWVGEGLPVPTYKDALKTITVDYFKAVAMAALSRELFKHGLASERSHERQARRTHAR
jgi:hypothetical protein